ncbi:beta-N-acetylhexosaminidase [Altericroceibacterium endophyticum]|uniref:beta-N-acetylhexosaminidase n=1 Tax=Altericroceibacterium endophyticum TaxID=1808508 RepID=A0A6I4T6F5_9SPHN|nr:beta-N-acetylhexosaminidase [Altericroceibacterium endophyticum]MXO66496.1 beta-N-acetylhexosaminidase [Altericroceibacterium endophyticum]
MTPAIFGLSGLTLNDDERAFFKESDPAGYVLFARNIENRQQLRALTDDLRAVHGRDDLLISIDQEGGRVARMKPPEWDAFPSGAVFADLYDLAPASAIEAARVNAQMLAFDLAEAGINVDYLPLLDVRQPGAHDVIGDRALGGSPMQVAALGRAILDGLASGGVTGCIKHIPGHGRAGADSHKELPVVDAARDELAIDFEPFRTLNHAPIGMSAHVLYTALDSDRPATLSPTIITDIIRGEIGFDGLLLTDDVDMEALSGTVPERAAAALAAGCDIVLNCWAKMADMEGIAAACPSITENAAARLQRALHPVQNAADLPDRSELAAKRDQLLDLVKQNA